MATSPPALRAQLQAALQNLATGDLADNATHGRPTVALIRLLTRLIFVWFLKEKRLVPPELFSEAALAKLLKNPPHQHGKAGNYYQAILQNLFFFHPQHRSHRAGCRRPPAACLAG